MKRFISFMVAIVLSVIPVFSLSESDSLPFSFDLNGNPVTVTAVKSYTSVPVAAYGKGDSDVVLVVIDIDVSSLPDDMLKSFFDTVNFIVSCGESISYSELLSNVVSVVWTDSQKAQCVKVYNKESLSSEQMVIHVFVK